MVRGCQQNDSTWCPAVPLTCSFDGPRRYFNMFSPNPPNAVWMIGSAKSTAPTTFISTIDNLVKQACRAGRPAHAAKLALSEMGGVVSVGIVDAAAVETVGPPTQFAQFSWLQQHPQIHSEKRKN